MYTNIAVAVLLWAVYYFIHSFLAGEKCKNKIRNTLGWSNRQYRLFYSTVAVLGLVPVLGFLATTRSPFLLEKTEWLKYISLALSTWGVVLIKQAMKKYRWSAFLGFADENKATLQTSGIFGYIRHPLYAGTLLLLVGFWLFIPNVLNLTTVVVSLVYLRIGIGLEEKKLIQQYGSAYISYKKEVPALVPRIKR